MKNRKQKPIWSLCRCTCY